VMGCEDVLNDPGWLVAIVLCRQDSELTGSRNWLVI
jgi:hypothetical protein